MTKLNIESIKTDQWRNSFHIQPPQGLLNDPNGLVYHNGVYHVFYQWHPDAPVHGLKYWNHVTSTDLVHWEYDERILEPNTPYDKDGAYSGSAFVIDDQIEIFYTGNTRTEDGNRVPYQIQTQLLENGFGERVALIEGMPEGYTDHFRDPKIFQRGDQYYMILGAQRDDLTGTAVIYTSDTLKDWTFAYDLKTNYPHLGYMWECPDLFRLGDCDVMVFCPQGSMNEPQDKTNIYPAAYLIGEFDAEQGSFMDASSLKRLDYGFEFYAAQTFLDENQDTVLFAWVGMPEVDYPTDAIGWAHVLSIPRILSVKDNYLYQEPHPNLKLLREQELTSYQNLRNYEMKISQIESDFSMNLYETEEETLSLSYHKNTGILSLDRGKMIHIFGEEFGLIREIELDEGLNSLQIFRDTSTIEIFINGGKYTMTSRFFPKTIEGNISIESSDSLSIELYALKEQSNDL